LGTNSGYIIGSQGNEDFDGNICGAAAHALTNAYKKPISEGDVNLNQAYYANIKPMIGHTFS